MVAEVVEPADYPGFRHSCSPLPEFTINRSGNEDCLPEYFRNGRTELRCSSGNRAVSKICHSRMHDSSALSIDCDHRTETTYSALGGARGAHCPDAEGRNDDSFECCNRGACAAAANPRVCRVLLCSIFMRRGGLHERADSGIRRLLIEPLKRLVQFLSKRRFICFRLSHDVAAVEI